MEGDEGGESDGGDGSQFAIENAENGVGVGGENVDNDGDETAVVVCESMSDGADARVQEFGKEVSDGGGSAEHDARLLIESVERESGLVLEDAARTILVDGAEKKTIVDGDQADRECDWVGFFGCLGLGQTASGVHFRESGA